MQHPTDRIAHTTAFVTQVVEHWLEPEINIIEANLLTVFFVSTGSHPDTK